MSLTISGNNNQSIEPIPQGTHLAVCNLLVDLGVQYNEYYKSSAKKVLIGWELPEETLELEDGKHTRNITKRYTASLNEAATLRQDLASWRGRDFTGEELEAFNLKQIVGTSCLLNIIHKESNGKTYANVQSIMALPKGMQKGRLSKDAIVFDLDSATLDDVDELPNWIGDIVKKSSTYQEMLAKESEVAELPENNGDLPF